ncbi:MAG: MBL fold metallo-hydrolase, partial [Pseudomonadota bacterium]
MLRAACVGLAAFLLSACDNSGPVEIETEVLRTDQVGSPNASCPSEGTAIQVLGSGGPIAEGPTATGRAGASYLLWIDGTPRLLIDAGAGSFLRFAEAGGKVASLDAILVSHLHADHAGDLAGILNTGGFEGRTTP